MAFRRKYGSNIIQAQFWDHIWNSLIKADFLDHQYENGIDFFLLPGIFKILSLEHEPKKQFLREKNDIVFLFTSHATGLAPKAWEQLSSMKSETP